VRHVLGCLGLGLAAAGGAATASAAGLFLYVGGRLRTAYHPLAGVAYLVPMMLAGLGIVLLMLSGRWRWALGAAGVAGAAFFLSLALLAAGG